MKITIEKVGVDRWEIDFNEYALFDAFDLAEKSQIQILPNSKQIPITKSQTLLSSRWVSNKYIILV